MSIQSKVACLMLLLAPVEALAQSPGAFAQQSALRAMQLPHAQMLAAQQQRRAMFAARRKAQLAAVEKARLASARNENAAAAELAVPKGLVWKDYLTGAFVPPILEGSDLVSTQALKFPSETHRVLATDTRTGKERWNIALPKGVKLETWPVSTGDLILFGTSDYQVIALQRETGRERFRVRLAPLKLPTFAAGFQRMTSLLIDGSRCFVGTRGKGARGEMSGTLYAFDLSDGKIAWESALTEGAMGELVHDHGMVIAGAGRWVTAVLAGNGQEVWKHYTDNTEIDELGQYSGGRYYLKINRELRALDMASGKRIWSDRIGSNSPVLVGSEVVGAIETRSGEVEWAIGFDPFTGKRLWEAELGRDSEHAWLPVSIQGGQVILLRNRDLIALGTADGKQTWHFEAPGKMTIVPAPYGSLLLTPSQEGDQTVIYALHERTGKAVWSFPVGLKSGEGFLLPTSDGILFPGQSSEYGLLR